MSPTRRDVLQFGSAAAVAAVAGTALSSPASSAPFPVTTFEGGVLCIPRMTSCIVALRQSPLGCELVIGRMADGFPGWPDERAIAIPDDIARRISAALMMDPGTWFSSPDPAGQNDRNG